MVFLVGEGEDRCRFVGAIGFGMEPHGVKVDEREGWLEPLSVETRPRTARDNAGR